jgi:arylsulfatase A-like enzyme
MHAPRRYLERFAHLADPERQVYAAMLACVDDNIGRVLEFLEKHKLRENTFIAFASDNGATREPRAGRNREPAKGGSNAPHRGAKFSLFEGGIRVPGILNWPARIPAKQVIQEPVLSADVFPTFTAAAGVSLPKGRTYDGRDLLPVATARAKSPHEALYWASGKQLAVRRGNWKWIRNVIEADGSTRGQQPLGGEDEIFLANLANDPGEAQNLRHREPAIAAELEKLAASWLTTVKNA